MLNNNLKSIRDLKLQLDGKQKDLLKKIDAALLTTKYRHGFDPGVPGEKSACSKVPIPKVLWAYGRDLQAVHQK